MTQKKGRNFLIRNIPENIFILLEKAAKENHRSKTQEAIIALHNGLSIYTAVPSKSLDHLNGKKNH